MQHPPKRCATLLQADWASTRLDSLIVRAPIYTLEASFASLLGDLGQFNRRCSEFNALLELRYTRVKASKPQSLLPKDHEHCVSLTTLS